VAGGVSCPGADDNVAPVVARLQSRSGDAEANGLGRQCDGRRHAENGPRRYHPKAAQEATVVPDLPGDVEIVLSQLPAFPGQEPGEADIEMRRVALGHSRAEAAQSVLVGAIGHLVPAERPRRRGRAGKAGMASGRPEALCDLIFGSHSAPRREAWQKPDAATGRRNLLPPPNRCRRTVVEQHPPSSLRSGKQPPTGQTRIVLPGRLVSHKLETQDRQYTQIKKGARPARRAPWSPCRRMGKAYCSAKTASILPFSVCALNGLMM